MDPATAFQLACGTIQLIEFGIRTTKDLREIWKSTQSLTAEYERLSDGIFPP